MVIEPVSGALQHPTKLQTARYTLFIWLPGDSQTIFYLQGRADLDLDLPGLVEH